MCLLGLDSGGYWVSTRVEWLLWRFELLTMSPQVVRWFLRVSRNIQISRRKRMAGMHKQLNNLCNQSIPLCSRQPQRRKMQFCTMHLCSEKFRSLSQYAGWKHSRGRWLLLLNHLNSMLIFEWSSPHTQIKSRSLWLFRTTVPCTRRH